MKRYLVHLFTEVTFISSVKKYEYSLFRNKVILIDEESRQLNSDVNINGINVSIFHLEDIDQVIGICCNADLVVIHRLCPIKVNIINKLPQNVMVLLRFYGAELYRRLYPRFYTNLTTQYLRENNNANLLKSIAKRHYNLIKIFLGVNSKDEDFFRALFRVNLFMCLFEEEYSFLKMHWPDLPKFLQLPFGKIKNNVINSYPKKNSIIIGNSRSPFNNHFDILKIINSACTGHTIEYILPFSYGRETPYSKKLKKTLLDRPNFTLLESFYDRQKYEEFFMSASAIVINAKRQLAMGNIFVGIRHGLKIYLNKENLVYLWMQKEGFKVSCIEDFAADLISGDIKLSYKDAIHNLNCHSNLAKKYCLEVFHKSVCNIIERHKVY